MTPVNRFQPISLNFCPEVVAGEAIRQPITVTDATLREGQQAPEVAFTPEDEVAIARKLHAIGVPAIQVGYAGTDDPTTARIRRSCPGLTLVVVVVGWLPSAETQLRSALEVGGDVCSVLLRSASPHIVNLGLRPEEVRKLAGRLVREAKTLGWRKVMFSPTHTTSADLNYLMSLYQEAVDAGADILSVSDSMGKAKPAAVRHLVSRIRTTFRDVGIRVHMHNDFGLAVANTLAGVEAGADWVDATVNGLGERAGNCPLEEVVIALEALYGVKVGIRTEALYALCKLVSELSGVAIHPMKPLAGENCFSNKLEIHVKAAATEPSLMEPYDPSLVGNRRTLRLGRGTGVTGVRLKLHQLNVDLPEQLVERLVRLINDRAVATKRGISEEEFRQLIRVLQKEAGPERPHS